MTRYRIRHRTHYEYGAPVDLSHHLLRLDLLELPHQRVLDRRVAILPRPAALREKRDHFGNGVAWIVLEMPHQSLTVELRATVEVDRHAPRGPVASPPWEAIRATIRDDGFPSEPLVAEYGHVSPYALPTPGVQAYAAKSFPASCPVLEAVRDLTTRIHRDFTYVPGATDLSTPVATVMADRRGVCQDFAHVMIAGLRAVGLPARYVSGYLRTYPPAGADPHALRGADATHAWVGVWCGPELGWIEFDPTNDLVVDEEHIVLAYGRDFGDISPLRGVILGGGDHQPSVAVTVEPLPDAV
ncbi:MAG: transglutaminase N-terminal domain-containing protein [Alphaproteobacteria bacterium]